MDETQGYCPVFHRAVELIGRRWNGPIIRALLDGADRFGEIRSRIPGLTDRLLDRSEGGGPEPGACVQVVPVDDDVAQATAVRGHDSSETAPGRRGTIRP